MTEIGDDGRWQRPSAVDEEQLQGGGGGCISSATITNIAPPPPPPPEASSSHPTNCQQATAAAAAAQQTPTVSNELLSNSGGGGGNNNSSSLIGTGCLNTFFNELNSLNSTKLPVSKIKIQSITNLALKCEKQYKHVVFYIEKFIKKCKTEYKLPTFYVIDSLLRKALLHYNTNENIFALRILKIFHVFLEFAATSCSKVDCETIIKVLSIWDHKKLFPANILDYSLRILAEKKLDLIEDLKSEITSYFESRDINSIYIDTIINKKTLLQPVPTVISTESLPTDQNFPSANIDTNNLTNLKSINKQFKQLIQLIGDFFEYKSQVRIDRLEPLLDKINEIYLTTRTNCVTLYEQNPNVRLLTCSVFITVQRIHNMMLNELQKETERELHLVPSKQLPKGCMEKPIIDPFAMMLDGSIAKSTEKRQIQEGQKNPEASHSDSNSDFSNNPPNRLPKSEKNSDTDLKLEQNKPSLEAEEILKFEEFKPYLKPQHVVVLSDTVWIGKLPKNYPEVHIMRDIENFGEIINIRYISTRGCAYVQMMQRSDAELLKNKYQSIKPTNKFDFPRSQLKLAWAPPTDLKDLLKSFWSLSLGIFLIPWSFFTSQMFDKIKYCNSFLLHCTLPPNFGPLIMSNDLLLDYQIRSDLQQLKKPVNINKEKDLSFSKKLTNLKRETSSETERYNNPTDPKYSACPEASPSKMRKRSGSPSLSQNNTNSDNNKYKQIKTNQTRPQSHNYSSQMHAQNSRVSRDNKSRHGSSSSRERVSNNSSNSSNAKSTSSSRNQQHQSRPHKNQQYSRNPNNSSTRQATSSSTNNHQQSWPTPSSRWSPNSRISPPPESTSSNYQKNFRSSSRHSNSNSTPTSAANETSNSMTSPLNRKAPHNESDAPDSTKESRSADSHFKSASRSESLISSNVSRDNSRMATSQAPESSTIHKSSPSSLSTIKSHSSMSKRSQLSSSSPSAPPIAKVSSSISDKIISKLLQNYAMKKGTNKALSDRPLDKMKAAIFSSGEIPEINYRNHEEFVRMFFNKEYMRESLSSMLGQESLDDGYFNDLPDRVDKESINSLIDFYNQMNSGSPMSLIGHKNSQKPGATSFVTNELSNAQHHQHCSSSNSAATSASRSAESRVAKALTKSTLPPPPPPN